MKGKKIEYTDEQVAFLHTHKEMLRKDLTALFNSTFGTDINQRSLTAKCERIGALTGRSGRFEKGMDTWNKGVKGYMGANATSFKKGQKPNNTRPLYSERVCAKDGYILIKVRETHPQFVLKHRWLWEQVHGSIPEGHNIVFKNKDRTDIRLENLVMVSNRENAILNRCYSKLSNPSSHESLILLSKIKAFEVAA